MPGLLADETREHQVFVAVKMIVIAASEDFWTKRAGGCRPGAGGLLEIGRHHRSGAFGPELRVLNRRVTLVLPL